MSIRAAILTMLSACALPAQATPPAAVTVHGHVLDVLGAGVAAAEVWVTAANGAVLGRAVADGEGLFQVRKLPAGTALVLHGRAAGRVDATVDIGEGGELRATSLTLEEGVRLHGRVTLSDGTPIAGAAVVASALLDPLQQRATWSMETATDAHGDYALAMVPMPAVEVGAWAPGRAFTTVTVQTQRDAACDLALPPGPAQPRRVQLAGLPSGAKASVYVVRPRRVRGTEPVLPQPLRVAAVAADGAALLWPLPFGHEVGVDAPGHASRPLYMRCAAASTDALTFAIAALPADLVAPATPLSGRVVDELGHPLAGVRVRCSALTGPCTAEAVSDADGRFAITAPVRARVLCQLGLAPGQRLLGDPGATLAVDGVTWLSVPADPAVPVTLHAIRAASIHGTARNEAGAPLGYADVALTRFAEPAKGRSANLVLRSATDAAGHVELPGLPAGRYQLVVADQCSIGTAEITVAAGASVDFDRLELTPVGEVVGTVRDEHGAAIAGAWLGFLRNPRNPGARMAGWARTSPRDNVRTDRNGRFRARARAEGAWAVFVAEAAGNKPAKGVTTFEVTAGETTTVEIEVAR